MVQFRFSDLPASTRDWWLVITPEEADVCDVDPGYPVGVSVTASLRRMVEVWRGDLGWSDALRSGAVEVHGPEALRRALPGWFTLSPFASVPRPAWHLRHPAPCPSRANHRPPRTALFTAGTAYVIASVDGFLISARRRSFVCRSTEWMATPHIPRVSNTL